MKKMFPYYLVFVMSMAGTIYFAFTLSRSLVISKIGAESEGICRKIEPEGNKPDIIVVQFTTAEGKEIQKELDRQKYREIIEKYVVGGIPVTVKYFKWFPSQVVIDEEDFKRYYYRDIAGLIFLVIVSVLSRYKIKTKLKE